MADAKLDVKLGSISFVGEGSEKWLSEQLKVILAEAPKLAAIIPDVPPEEKPAPSAKGTGGGKFTTALGSYLSEKGASNNQNKRFIATADWLRRRGVTPLNTAAVTKALRDNHQLKLGNPAQCLNSNVSQGYAEKSGKDFFITPEGLKLLGH